MKVAQPFEAMLVEAPEPVADAAARGPEFPCYRRAGLPERSKKNHASAPVEAGLAALPAGDLAKILALFPRKAHVHACCIGRTPSRLYQNFRGVALALALCGLLLALIRVALDHELVGRIVEEAAVVIVA